MRNMLDHYIITVNDLARRLKYRVLDSFTQRDEARLGTPELD